MFIIGLAVKLYSKNTMVFNLHYYQYNIQRSNSKLKFENIIHSHLLATSFSTFYETEGPNSLSLLYVNRLASAFNANNHTACIPLRKKAATDPSPDWVVFHKALKRSTTFYSLLFSVTKLPNKLRIPPKHPASTLQARYGCPPTSYEDPPSRL